MMDTKFNVAKIDLELSEMLRGKPGPAGTVDANSVAQLADATNQVSNALVAVNNVIASTDQARKSMDDRFYPGVYANPPLFKPSGAERTTGDRAVITVNGVDQEHIFKGGAWVKVLDSGELAVDDGAALIGYDGGTAQDVLDSAKPLADYAALRAYTGRAKGVRITGKGIAGTFLRDLADTTTADDGGTVIVDASGRRWQRAFEGAINTRWFGAVGNGVADDGPALQAAIDAGRGKTVVVPQGRYLAAGVSLNGASYDGTRLVFEGEFVLKQRPAANSSTFGGAWVGLLIKDCNRVELIFRGDGQRVLQPNEEHVYLVGVAGAVDLSVPSFVCREIRGDGMYVSQSNWAASSANTTGLTIGTFEATNAVADGRNGLSIISADDVLISAFRSHRVGGVVGGVRQPGGLDIEPNVVTQSCKRITIGSVNVVTAGTSGLAVQGRPNADVTRDVSVAVASVINTCPADVADGTGAITQTANHTILILSAANVTVAACSGVFTSAYGDAIIVSDSKGVQISGTVRHVRMGARVGNDARDASGPGVLDSRVSVDVADTCRFGLQTGKVTRCRFGGSVGVPTTGFYVDSLFGVHALLHAQTDSTYSVSVQADAGWTRSYRRDSSNPPTFSNVVIRDCDLSGGAWAGLVQQAGDMPVPRIGVRGVTNRSAVPSVGTGLWTAGQRFDNDAATTGATSGWIFDGTAMRALPTIGGGA